MKAKVVPVSKWPDHEWREAAGRYRSLPLYRRNYKRAEEILTEFTKAMAERRQELGMQIADVCEVSELSVTSIQRLTGHFRGTTRYPTLGTMVRLANALQMDLEIVLKPKNGESNE